VLLMEIEMYSNKKFWRLGLSPSLPLRFSFSTSLKYKRPSSLWMSPFGPAHSIVPFEKAIENQSIRDHQWNEKRKVHVVWKELFHSEIAFWKLLDAILNPFHHPNLKSAIVKTNKTITFNSWRQKTRKREKRELRVSEWVSEWEKRKKKEKKRKQEKEWNMTWI
jgi:hypothetical protein